MRLVMLKEPGDFGIEDDEADEDSEATKEEMEEWFRAHFEDPAERTPYESAEGGYIWIWGGPYDAFDELYGEFGGTVADDLIEELAAELTGENPEWAPVPSPSDYDDFLFESVSANENALETFEWATGEVEQLLNLQIGFPLDGPLNRLLYANVIAALETYLSDAFINTVLREERHLRRFVETNLEFGKKTFSLSEVFKQAEKIPDEAKRYLTDMVWHNLAKVQAIYRATLNISFGSEFSAVGRAIQIRHDIVHRNGRTKEGAVIALQRSDVEKLIADVTALVRTIDQQIDSLPHEPREEDDRF